MLTPPIGWKSHDDSPACVQSPKAFRHIHFIVIVLPEQNVLRKCQEHSVVSNIAIIFFPEDALL
jgi:hypothetical protein